MQNEAYNKVFVEGLNSAYTIKIRHTGHKATMPEFGRFAARWQSGWINPHMDGN